MLSNIIHIYPNRDLITGLTRLIEEIKEGSIANTRCTIVINKEIYSLGDQKEDSSFKNAVFDITLGQHKLLNLFTLED